MVLASWFLLFQRLSHPNLTVCTSGVRTAQPRKQLERTGFHCWGEARRILSQYELCTQATRLLTTSVLISVCSQWLVLSVSC